jgi:hypothetical protein
VKAAGADKWLINQTAAASNGLTIDLFESGPARTNGQAGRLLERIWKKESGDIAFGTAPRKLSDPNRYED